MDSPTEGNDSTYVRLVDRSYVKELSEKVKNAFNESKNRARHFLVF